jgi:ferredoxin-NADP reductase
MGNPIKAKAVVISIERYGEGVYLVTLRPDGRLPRFKAGQFLHLTLDEYDPAGGFWPESRVFSIASRQEDENLVIVYSVKGVYTSRMAEQLTVGRSLWLKLPFGDFVIQSKMRAGNDAVLVAGGTGISPFIPFLSEASGKVDGKTRLYYGVRDAALVLFKPLLSRCVGEGAIDLRLWIEEAPIGNEDSGLDVATVQGRLDVARVYDECSDLADPRFFLSGPPRMIEVFKNGLLARGIGPDKIHSDDWE